MASVSQFAAPRDGDASVWFVCNATPPGLREAPERGDIFAVRSPQGRRRLILICVSRHSAWSPRTPRKWRRFRSSRPPGPARPDYVLRMTPLRWAKWRQFRNSQPPRGYPDWHRTARKSPKREAQDGQEIQDCPNNAQYVPKTCPVRPQQASKRPQGRPRGPQTGPRDFKMAQEAPKTAPKRPKRPRRPRPHQASKRLQDRPKTAGGGPEALQ